MQDNKYFYKGIPITEYCREHDIKVSTIRGRIWKKLHNKKNENYSLQEIIDMVMESYGTSVKYMYKGISLRQYCLNNNINVTTINSRINFLKKNNPSLTNDELVILAMDEFENNNFRFYYNGISLKDYCMTNPDINYNTIRSYINREKERHPELTDEELIEKYIEKEHKGIYKYYYLGIPLVEYCKQKGLNYKNIITYISKHNKEGQIIRYMDLSVKGYFRKYLKNYKMSHKTVSLDGAKYSSDKGTKKEKKLVDYISDNNNPYEEIGKEQFSSKMKSVLKNLPSDDLKFIILRFQENYDYEELSEILNITVEEVKKKELDILTKLKSNDTIKVMKK